MNIGAIFNVQSLIQILAAGIGALSFAMIFNAGRKSLLFGAIGGMLGWVVYLLGVNNGLGVFMSAAISAGFCQIYSEVFARLLKSPATVFYIPSIVPLVPGGSLYYTMYYVTKNDWSSFKSYGWSTLLTALGIAVGASFVSAALLLLPNKKK